jgi:hypothetical protein
MTIKENYLEQAFEEAKAETEVYKISRKIQSLLGFEDVPEGFNEEVGRYRIITTNRIFNNGWQRLFEINPIYCNKQVGYINNERPNWPLLREGTKTINLPPVEAVKEVLEILDGYNITTTQQPTPSE